MASLPQVPTNRPAQQAGSGFTNLSKYLQANQSNQLGNAVAGGVQQAGQQARGAINTAGQNFQQQLGTEKQRLGQVGEKVNSILGNIPGATDEDVNTMANVRGGEYKGPTGVADANALRSQATEAESLGRAGGSEAGRFGLLQRFVGRGNNNYGLGSQRLDNMLLGQQGGQQLNAARAGTRGITNTAEKQIGAAQAQGQEGQGQAQQLAQSTIGKLGQQVSDYDTAMAAQLASKQADTNALIQQFGAAGAKPNTNTPVQLDANVLQQLSDASSGVLKEGTGLYQGDYTPYIQANQLYANNRAAQGADDLAKIQMLGKLSGNSLAGQASGNTLQDYITNPAMAGQYDANQKFSVASAPALAKALQDSKSTYETYLKNNNDLLYGLDNKNLDPAFLEQLRQGEQTLPSEFNVLRTLQKKPV